MDSENQEIDDVIIDGPPLNSFIELSRSFYRLMNYRRSRNANHHLIKKNGRILKEIKQFQFIQFDLQNCTMSNERRRIQKEALFVAQQLSLMSDPPEVQQEQYGQSNQSSHGKNESSSFQYYVDENDDDFCINTQLNFSSLGIPENMTYNGNNGNYNNNSNSSNNNYHNNFNSNYNNNNNNYNSNNNNNNNNYNYNNNNDNGYVSFDFNSSSNSNYNSNNNNGNNANRYKNNKKSRFFQNRNTG